MDIIAFLLNVPVIVKVITTIILFMVFNKLFNNLLLAIVLGTAALGFWSGHGPRHVLEIAWEGLGSPDSLFLIASMFLVIWLSSQMGDAGYLRKLVESVRQRFSPRISMAVLPALIGLIPMPGGALFSAPLVDECDPTHELKPILKTQINFWFRHVWEYWWPLYPGVILASDMLKLPIWQFLLVQIPVSAVAIITGAVFLLRKAHGLERHSHERVQGLLGAVFPIVLIVGTYACVNIAFPALSRISEYLPMCVALGVAMITLQIVRPLQWRIWKKNLFSLKTLSLAAMVAMIRVYSAFIQARLPDGVFLMEKLRAELALYGIPMLLLIMILPFLSALTSGMAIAFVGASFPIVASLLGADSRLSLVLATLVLAYTSGYAGIILSPVHTCHILTAEYFKTSLWLSIARLSLPTSVLVVFAVGLYFLVKVMGF